MNFPPEPDKVSNIEWHNLVRAAGRAGLGQHWNVALGDLKKRGMIPRDYRVQMRAWLAERLSAEQKTMYLETPAEVALPAVAAEQAPVKINPEDFMEPEDKRIRKSEEEGPPPPAEINSLSQEHAQWCVMNYTDEAVTPADAPSPMAGGVLAIMRNDPQTAREVVKRFLKDTYVRRDDEDVAEEGLRLTGLDDRLREEFKEGYENVAQFIRRAEGLSGKPSVAAVPVGQVAPAGTGTPMYPAGLPG
jgi:hypothetical protein